MNETRPKDYPKLKDYKPTQFMLPTSHYDKEKADRAVRFIEMLPHTKGEWAGKPFWLLPWQEQLVRDIFGVVKEDGNRQFRMAFVEICKKVGKSELAAANARYLLYADNEPSAEVYGAASDRSQAAIVFDVAKRMVELTPALSKRSKIMAATKRLVNYSNAGFYQVLSAEVGTKHGLNVSGLVFDEIHALPNRELYDVLTKGASDARQNPLAFIITTAGNNRESIGYELHQKAKIERLRDAFNDAIQNPADEVTFRWLRLNQWVGSTVAWIPDAVVEAGNQPINEKLLEGRDCYAGLDLSSSEDITALALLFPPRTEDEKYILLLNCWVPEDTISNRVRKTGFPYDKWKAQGYLHATPGNVIDYAYIVNTIEELAGKYHICEIAYDRWGSNMIIQRLQELGLTVVPFGQGFKDMSAPSKELYEQMMKGNFIHGGNPVFRWMCGNIVMDIDPAGNIKPTKKRSNGKIDGVVATIMALDRCLRHEEQGSVYDNPDHGLWVF
jgi:phage terminase large subunit-like protein